MATNSLYQAVDYDMAEWKGRESGINPMQIPQNVAYSVAGVATSVATSFYNTGIMVGNIFRDDDIDFANTGDWVQKWAGGQAAEFYEDHSDIIELGGLVAGSFAPGMAAVKGFRAFQASRLKGLADVASGKPLSTYSRVATGLKNSVLPPSQINKLTLEIRKGNVNALYNPGERLKLFRDGTRQQLLESFVYEAATVGTMVANPTLANEELDYIDALSQNFGSFLFGGAFGGAAGGLISYAVSKGKLDKVATEVSKELNPYAVNLYKSTKADIFGDRLVDEVNAVREKAEQVSTLERTLNKIQRDPDEAIKTEKVRNALRLAKSSLQQAKNKVMEDIGSNVKNVFAKQKLSEMLEEMEPKKLAEFAAGMDSITTLNATGNLRDPVLDLVLKIEGVEDPLPFGVQYDVKQKFLKIDKADLQKMNNDEVLQMWDASVAGLQGQKALDILEGSRLMDDMTKELRIYFDKEHQVIRDRIEMLQKKMFKAEDEEAARLGEMVAFEDAKLARLERHPEALRNLYRAALDADEDTFRQMKKDMPTIVKAFQESRGMQTVFGPTEAYLDINTGNLARADAVVPRAADLGEITIRNNAARIEGTSYAFDLRTTKPIDQMTLMEATAKYQVAENKPEQLLQGYQGPKGQAIDTFDLPRAYAALHKFASKDAYRTKTADGKIKQKLPAPIKYKTVDGEAKEFRGVLPLMRELKRTKRNAVARLAERGRFSMGQIAEMLDTDVSWVNGHHLTTGHPDDFSLAFRQFERGPEGFTFPKQYSDPRWLKIDYKRTFESEAEIHGQLQQEMRMQREYQISKETALTHFGDDAKNLSDDLNVMEVGAADRTAEAVTANHDRYDIVGYKGGGAVINTRHNKRLVEVPKAYSKVTQHLVKNEDAIAELNVTRNMARQGKYYYFSSLQDMLEKEIAVKGDVYRDFSQYFLADATTGQIISRTLRKKLGMNEGALLHQDIISPIRNAIASADAYIGQALKNGEQVNPDRVIAFFRGLELPNVNAQAAKGAKKHYVFANKEAEDFVKMYVDENNKTIRSRRSLAERRGENISFEENMFYAGAIDTERYNAVNYVQFNDAEKIYGSKNVGVIVANTEEDLLKKRKVLEREFGDAVKVVSRGEQEDFLRAAGIYEADIDITENVVDTTMYNRGVLWDVMPEYNENVAAEMVTSQIKSLRNLDRGYIQLLYEKEIAQLREMEKAYTPQSFIDRGKQAAAANAWKRQINTLLDIPTDAQSSWYTGAQQKMAEGLMKAYGAMRGLFKSASQSQLDEEWKRMDRFLEKTGMPRPYSGGVENYLKVNSNLPNDTIEAMVAKANSVAATLMLRLDSAQAMVNALSLPIMLAPGMKELRQFVDEKTLKHMENMTTVKGPEGIPEPSNWSLAFDATAEFFTAPNRKELITELKAQGIVGNTLHEIQSATEAITLTPGKDVGAFRKGLDKAVSIAAKPGDKSEEFVKFVAARIAKKMMQNSPIPEKSQWAIVRSFVDRVHGNYVSSQRPAAFRGFAGQAIGLFQTYQFNLFQQLFGAVARGDKSAVKAMIGTQASIFGAQSIPGFQLLNDHIAQRHSDYENLYSMSRKNLGDELSEWLIYGSGSNMFKPIPGLGGIDLYSRGDLTPRTPILVPTTPSEIPVIAITSKAIGTFANMMGKTGEALQVGQPQAIPTIAMEALAHNGFNRPLAGISQLALGYRTTNQGSLINTYSDSDRIGWAAAVKAMGAKELNEGIAVNQYYRAMGYRTSRLNSTAEMGKALKDIIRSGGGSLTGEVYMDFMRKYVENGGTYDGFRQWVQNQMTGATESVVNELRRNNTSPEGRYLQSVMGADLKEFREREF